MNIMQEELESLRTQLLEMCRSAELMVSEVTSALDRHDESLAHIVFEADKHIDEVELDIEKKCMRFLVKRQPVAKDFRAVSAILKVITDVERIGDQAADIAALIPSLKPTFHNDDLCAMAGYALAMVKDCITAFFSLDVKAAAITAESDDLIDELYASVKKKVVELIRADSENVDDAIHLLMISKYFERIGDHAVNVCEWTDYYVNGVRKKVDGKK